VYFHMVFPWFSHDFPIFPWFSIGFPMVFPWFPPTSTEHRHPPGAHRQAQLTPEARLCGAQAKGLGGDDHLTIMATD
jgi:hypothetical protein